MATITKPDTLLSAGQQATTTRTFSKNILVAVDDSDQSAHAVRYVGSLLNDTHDARVTLFHALRPMPRELMEHGGSENPDVEDRLGAQLRKQQEEWMQAEEAVAYPVLLKALEQLEQAGFPIDHVTLKFGYERDTDTVDTIIHEAKSGVYGAIVVTRHETAGVKRLFSSSITDRLLRDLSGTAIWVLG